MKKKILVILIACMWVAVAAGFIASKQFTLKTGKTVVLETVPVDPRDLLRGDYVILSYKIGQLEFGNLNSEKKNYNHGEIVYVGLVPKGKYWEAVSVSSKRPTESSTVFIKGRITQGWGGRIGVNYGIESYFVPEGKGREFEQGLRRGSQVKVVVEAAVNADGNALIKKVYLEK